MSNIDSPTTHATHDRFKVVPAQIRLFLAIE